jgi:hypothetical protein
LFSVCSSANLAFQQRERIMQERGLDGQHAIVLAIGWIAALWMTLT